MNQPNASETAQMPAVTISTAKGIVQVPPGSVLYNISGVITSPLEPVGLYPEVTWTKNSVHVINATAKELYRLCSPDKAIGLENVKFNYVTPQLRSQLEIHTDDFLPNEATSILQARKNGTYCVEFARYSAKNPDELRKMLLTFLNGFFEDRLHIQGTTKKTSRYCLVITEHEEGPLPAPELQPTTRLQQMNAKQFLTARFKQDRICIVNEIKGKTNYNFSSGWLEFPDIGKLNTALRTIGLKVTRAERVFTDIHLQPITIS